MPSILPSYDYDLFISYRQKDNKGDRWVSEFVAALKTEIEATFKEDISIYFDENPNDRLQDTYNVDKSLEGKLKCLIFIPILSQTYCDPDCYAWKYEFLAFNRIAANDPFGPHVRLKNGNVANRILPIRIHDLDPDDVKLFEQETGTVLRAVDFVFKTASGVNRPLRADEDHPQDNLNRTYYRDQINKIAHAIKEMIAAIGQPEQKAEEAGTGVIKPLLVARKTKIKPIIAGLIILTALIFSGIILIPKLFRSEEHLEKSIAVLPFHNYSGDPGQEYLSDGLTDEIIGHLFKIKSFDKVVPLNDVLTYRGTDKRVSQIADELGVNYLLEGTHKKIGDQVSVTARLIEPAKGRTLWQQQYDEPSSEIIAIQAEIALQIADHLKAYLTNSGKQNIQKIPTNNQEAYDLIQRANYINLRTTSFSPEYRKENQLFDLVLKAIELDPDYADAYSSAGAIILANSNYGGKYELKTSGRQALQYFERALAIDPDNGNAHFGLAMLNDWFTWDYIKAEKEFLTALELLPNYPSISSQYGEFLIKMNRLKEAGSFFIDPELGFGIQYREIRRKILSGNQQEARRSLNEFIGLWKEEGYIWAGEAYIWLEEYDSARFYLENVKPSADPEILIPRFQACLALACQKTNDGIRARSIINQLIAISDTTSARSPEFFTGWYYSGIGQVDSAFYWLEKAYKNSSAEMPWLKVDPVLKNIRSDSRYWDLYSRTGHKAYDDYQAGMKK